MNFSAVQFNLNVETTKKAWHDRQFKKSYRFGLQILVHGHILFFSSSSSFSFLDHVPTSVQPVTLSVKSFKSVQSFLSN